MTREEKKKMTRSAIIAAAIQLFEQKGFEKTSIEELARHAGVGKGTIYTYFKNKTEIFYAFCDEQFEFIRAELAQKTKPEMPVIDQLMTIYMGEFINLTRNPEFGRLFMQQMLFPQRGNRSNYLEEVDNRWLDMLFTIFLQAQKKGELRSDIDPLYLAGHFYGLYIMVVSAWYTQRIETEEVTAAMRKLFIEAMNGLAPQPVS